MNNTDHTTPAVAQERGFDVLEIILALTRRWKLFAVLGLSFAVVVYLFSLSLKPRYTGTVTFLVDDQTASAGIILFKQTDPTLALLGSRAITEFVLQHIDSGALAADMKVNLASPDAGLALEGLVQSEVTASKSDQGVYSVKAQDHVPARAVSIANAYLEALQELSNRMSSENAAQTRAFYQQQLDTERRALEKAQAAVVESQAKTGLIQPNSQVGLEVGQLNSYRSQVVALEVQRANMAQSATSANPEMVRLNAQIAELNSKIATLQAKINSSAGSGLPSQTQEATNLQREASLHEAQLLALNTQLERARLQESYSIPKVHVVDRATLPAPKTFPKRSVMALAAGVFGLFIALVVTVISHTVERLRRDPVTASKLTAIRRSFAGTRD